MIKETCIHSGSTGLYGFRVPEGITKLKFVIKDEYEYTDSPKTSDNSNLNTKFENSCIISVNPGFDFSRGIYCKIVYFFNIETKKFNIAYSLYCYPDSPNDNYSSDVLYSYYGDTRMYIPSYEIRTRNWFLVKEKIIPFDVYYSDEINDMKSDRDPRIKEDRHKDEYSVDYVVINDTPKLEWKSIKSREYFNISEPDNIDETNGIGLYINIPKNINTLVIQPKYFDNFEELKDKEFYFKVNPRDTYFIRKITADIISTKKGKDYIRFLMLYDILDSDGYNYIELFNNYDDTGVEPNSNTIHRIATVFATISLINTKDTDKYRNLKTDYDV